MEYSEPALSKIRDQIRDHTLPDEKKVVRHLIKSARLSDQERGKISTSAAELVREIRENGEVGLMESFLAEYGLSTEEGVALMCLAEALLRVPDAETIDLLIEDKIAPSDWGKHLGQSTSSLVNASTWALLMTGKVLSDDEGDSLLGSLHGLVKRLGEPVIRTAVSRAMKEMGRQFVLGRTIEEAISEAREYEDRGYTYSYDMLGEAARTEADAKRYHLAYSDAISSLAAHCTSSDIRENPGISVKLSALHPRYEFTQKERVLQELVPRARSLALLAKSAGMGFNIDAEEADRLDLSLDVIEAIFSDPSLKDWDGFGVVVQAYGPRASHVLDWLYAMAERLDRKIMVRLVKGAYWDTEIKLAQTMGLSGFPVFTHKSFTDVSYIANARKLLGMTDRIYPQFATHNAHSVSAILAMAKHGQAYEFQRLHGMGETLHHKVLEKYRTRCRIYAPVGTHRDLLAYLVRRLLENGANSSFVNQIVDDDVAPETVAADPFAEVEALLQSDREPAIVKPSNLFGTDRQNSKGWNIFDPVDVDEILAAKENHLAEKWNAAPIVAFPWKPAIPARRVFNPANADDQVGEVFEANAADTVKAIETAVPWSSVPVSERAAVLNRAADLYEKNFGELFTLLHREAGKTLLDCIGELREAVDFLRYYASEASRRPECEPRGKFACISPWNFPLAIFTGQIAAALAAGNAVIAKPAETTSLIAFRAVQLLHDAGVPKSALQLLPGQGSIVGEALSNNPEVSGICFTGSTATGQRINRNMAHHLNPEAPLIAETGGINAMIVDSTALPEQAVRDILASAFQSAGQRCSALRVLYLQSDIYEPVVEMLIGAMDELAIGDPLNLATDVGPLIDLAAKQKIGDYVANASADGRLIKQTVAPDKGHFLAPTLIEVGSILDLKEEIFGPVLHVARFEADAIETVIGDINAIGYGLTFGLHTRIDDRVQQIVDQIQVGNIYVNRNQIGAIVGSQPFGGEGLSGTGPKAGGPHYLERFCKQVSHSIETPDKKTGKANGKISYTEIQSKIDAAGANVSAGPLHIMDLPGPTGETNRLANWPKGVVLCLGPSRESARLQMEAASREGCGVVDLSDLHELEALGALSGFAAVCFAGEETELRILRKVLADREGALVPLITDWSMRSNFHLERHLCVDTTASGGNAALLALQSD